MRHHVVAAICTLYLLVWCDLVCSALILSSLGQLGNRLAYLAVSLILALLFAWLVRRLSVKAIDPPSDSSNNENKLIKWGGQGIAWLSILAVVIPTILICTFYLVNNYDSIAYRFPRAFFYIGQGSLSQIPGDIRIQFYPFNISLVYVWFATYGLAGVWFNLFGFLTWLVGGVAVWRFARDIGAGQTSSLIASAIFITSPAVLVSASSTNDDLIAGVPLLIGAMFLVRWWRSGNWFDVLLAAIGLGISIGAKLHWVMMLPIAVILLVHVLYQLRRQRKLSYFLSHRSRQVFAAICMVMILVLPSFIINWNATGQLTLKFPDALNVPFSIVIACVHSLVSTASMLFGSIPDMYLVHSPEARQAFGDGFNNWINNHLLFWLTSDLHYVTEGFTFYGIGSNIAHLGVGEVTVWLGFVPWLLGLVVLLLLRKRNSQFQQIAFGLALVFFGWHFARDFMLKWAPAEGLYYAFIIGLAAPALAYLWEYKTPSSRIMEFLIKAGCVAVIATNLISASNYFMFNYQRNLPRLFAYQFQPDLKLISPQLGHALRSSQRTMIAYNRWDLPYFRLMNEQPNARYATTAHALTALPPSDFDLAFVLSPNGNLPMQFENDDRSRLSFLGYYGLYDTQSVFGHGPSVDKLVLQKTEEIFSQSKFALLELSDVKRNEKGGLVSIKFLKLHGVDADEDFLISATLITPDLGVTHVLEDELFSETSSINLSGEQVEGYLNIKLARRDKPSIAAHAWLPLDPKESWINVSKQGIVNINANETPSSEGFVSGWHSPSASSYRWMSGTTSEVTFPPLSDFNACSIEFEMISRGAGDIYIYLNGVALRKILPNNLVLPQKYRINLPDSAVAVSTNHIKFVIEEKNRELPALGLNAFSVDCGIYRGGRIY